MWITTAIKTTELRIKIPVSSVNVCLDGFICGDLFTDRKHDSVCLQCFRSRGLLRWTSWPQTQNSFLVSAWPQSSLSEPACPGLKEVSGGVYWRKRLEPLVGSWLIFTGSRLNTCQWLDVLLHLYEELDTTQGLWQVKSGRKKLVCLFYVTYEWPLQSTSDDCIIC